MAACADNSGVESRPSLSKQFLHLQNQLLRKSDNLLLDLAKSTSHSSCATYRALGPQRDSEVVFLMVAPNAFLGSHRIGVQVFVVDHQTGT